MSDFDWPPIPYADYLRQQLDTITEYEYINPKLNRRYDPVVLGGNAMHPVIQRGDLVLIDTAIKQPEDGQATAVRVGGGRTLIGYWRANGGEPVLEQERTEKVIDLGEYPGWEVYGIVTKIIGRGIPPHPPAVEHVKVSPKMARYVVGKLLDDGKLSRKDLRRYLRDMRTEIADLERRLSVLRSEEAER